MSGGQVDAENAKEQVLPYGTSTRPKDGVTVSSENKKPQKPKRKKKIRAKVASEQSPNPEEPGAPVAKPKSRSRNHPSNKLEPRAKESIGGEDQRKKRHSGTAKPTIHSTRRDKGKVPGQKLESKPQSGHQYPSHHSNQNPQRSDVMQKFGSEHAKSLSNSSLGSTKSVSSRSRSRSSRLGFDGTINMLTTEDSENKPREKQLDSISNTQQYNVSSTLNGDVPNSRRSKNLRQNHCESKSASINRNHNRGNASTNTFSNTGANIGKKETATIHHPASNGVERPVYDANANMPTSRFTTRRTIIWGAICCIIVIAVIVIPCVLLLVDFSGNDFPKLSTAKGVVASVTGESCNESVPKSGDCTLTASNDERQGGELCNLVAKSMLNTTIYGDIALINAGSCKKSLFGPELTAGNIKQAIDSESLVAVAISGADLIDALTGAIATSFGNSANSKAYPYAAGLRYNVEANLAPSERLSQVEVNLNLRSDEWTPIDIRRFYKVVTTKSVANGDRGYASFGNIIGDWKEPLNLKTGDAFYNYALKHSDDTNWAEVPSSEYSTQYFVEEGAEIPIAKVPNRICHATIPGQPTSSFCTVADVAQGSEVCNLLSWMIYDQNFGIDIALVKGYLCAGDIEEGKFAPSHLDTVISENKSLWKTTMLGSSVVTLINTGVAAGILASSGGELHYPYAAGLKFDVITKPSPMVSNVRVLASGGRWIPIVNDKLYTVVTTSDILSSSSVAEDMGTTLKEQVTGYAEDWDVFYKMSNDKASTQSFS